MSIIDRRKNGPGKSAPNRKRFIDRYKRQIKKSIEKNVRNRSIKDVEDGIDVGIDENTTSEPSYGYEPDSGRKKTVNSGNDTFGRGDRIKKPVGGGADDPLAGNDGEGEDPFLFTLTKEEFYELYFEDMELPDFIKESFKGESKFKYRRAGYTIDGVPMRLNKKKTMENAIARRIASRKAMEEEGRKPPYLDDLDVKYDKIIKVPEPVTRAIMFCAMDVSGSMMEMDKMLAKKFFLLLYLFLTKCYDTVEVRFIRHTHTAQEVDEETFFYGRESGGTIVSTAMTLISDIIDNEVDLETTNVYLSQVSDGDNWPEDSERLIEVLEQDILPKVQYMTYVQTRSPRTMSLGLLEDIYIPYKGLSKKHKNLKVKVARTQKEIYPALKELFERAKT